MSMKNFEDLQEGDPVVLEIGNKLVEGSCAVKLGPFKDKYQIFFRTTSAMAFPPFWAAVKVDANVYNGNVMVEYSGSKVKIFCDNTMAGKTLKEIKEKWPDAVIDDGKTVTLKKNKTAVEEEEEEEEEVKPKTKSKRPPQNVIDAKLASLCQKLIVLLGQGVKVSKIEKDEQGREFKIGPLTNKEIAKETIKSFGFKYIKIKKDGENLYLTFRPW